MIKKTNFYLAAFIAMGLAMFTKSSSSQPRGLRNNNPLNIRKSLDKWDGAALDQDDPLFVKFVTPAKGVRAASKILMTYRSKYGIATIQKIIERWAPRNENDTQNYINFVVKESGISGGSVLHLDQYPSVIAAMIKMEVGINPYSITEIKKWSEIA